MLEAVRQVKAYEAVIQQDASREELILEHLPQIKYIAHRISAKLPSHVEVNDLVGRVARFFLAFIRGQERRDFKRSGHVHCAL